MRVRMVAFLKLVAACAWGRIDQRLTPRLSGCMVTLRALGLGSEGNLRYATGELWRRVCTAW